MEQEQTWCIRSQNLIGEEAVEKLRKSHVLVVGVGGVGGYAAELLVRSGVGEMTLVDADRVEITNLNRQLPALHSTLGRKKVEVLEERFRDINPNILLHLRSEYLSEENIHQFFEGVNYDFVADAIDTLSPKIALIMEANRRKIPILSAMGAGAKMDVTKIEYADIWKTHHCPLSKSLREGLKKRGFNGNLPVVFSSEEPNKNAIFPIYGEQNKRSSVGSVAFEVATFGAYMAAFIVQHLIKKV